MAEALPADLSKVDPAEAWKTWQPAEGEWNRKWAAHLFRRAAFGPTPAELDKALADGVEPTLNKLLTGAPDAAELLDLFTETGRFCDEPYKLRVWWLYAMIEGGHPLREKLTLFWHNHFATSFAKIRNTQLMCEQNVTIRKHALGKFRPFLLDMSKDTAMLIWLDSNRNLKKAPNENYAREVMELFSLGVGNYTEKDIKEAARAFSGWHHNAEMSAFENNPSEHDDEEKTFLGKTGRWTGSDIVRICCDQPACGKFLVGKLYNFLVSETPPPKGLLDPLVTDFRKSQYDISALVRTMLASKLFFSEHAYRKRVKWPVEYAVGAVRAVTPGRVPMADLVEPLAKMGQVLFAPPNVKGWRTGTDWLNSATLLARNNFAETVALGEWTRPGAPRPPRGPQFATVAPTAPPAVMMPYPETAEAAVVGFAAASTAPGTIENPDGTKYVLVQPDLPPGAGGPATNSAPPPPPLAAVDAVATVYAAKPKNLSAVVKEMGELLYGEKVTTAQAAKIEKFLSEPGPAPSNDPPTPKGPPRRKGIKPDDVPTKSAEPPKVETQPKDKPDPKKPYKPEIDSPEFKARVREALHAMMCLPEYQLN